MFLLNIMEIRENLVFFVKRGFFGRMISKSIEFSRKKMRFPILMKIDKCHTLFQDSHTLAADFFLSNNRINFK